MRRISLLAFLVLIRAAQSAVPSVAVTIIPTETATLVSEVPESATATPENTTVATNTASAVPSSTAAQSATPTPTVDPCAFLTPDTVDQAGQECQTATSTATPVMEPTFDPCSTSEQDGRQPGDGGEFDCATETATQEPTVRPTYPVEIADPATYVPEGEAEETTQSAVAGVTDVPNDAPVGGVSGLPNTGAGTTGSSSPLWLLIVAAWFSLAVLVRFVFARSRA